MHVGFHLYLPLATLQLIRGHSTRLEVLPPVETMFLITKQIEATEKESENTWFMISKNWKVNSRDSPVPCVNSDVQQVSQTLWVPVYQRLPVYCAQRITMMATRPGEISDRIQLSILHFNASFLSYKHCLNFNLNLSPPNCLSTPAFSCRPYVSAQCSSCAAAIILPLSLDLVYAHPVRSLLCFLHLLKYSFTYKLKLARCMTTSDIHRCLALGQVRCDVSADGVIDTPSDMARNEGQLRGLDLGIHRARYRVRRSTPTRA